jgi:hypothetical protein
MAKTSDPCGAILVRIDPDLRVAAHEKAQSQGATVAGIVRALLRAWIEAPSGPLIPAKAEDTHTDKGQTT